MDRKALLGALLTMVALAAGACGPRATPTATTVPATATVVPATVAPPTATVMPSTATLPPTATLTARPTALPSATPTATAVVYAVKQNDTLFNIAAQYHVDVGALRQANQLTTTVLYIGQKLIIPGADFATPTPSPVPAGLPAGTKIRYTVLLGDTLESIAARFNSTVAEISRLNGDPTAPNNTLRHLSDRTLRAEMVIIVPVNIVTPTITATAGG
jgi:LysM repeat protein